MRTPALASLLLSMAVSAAAQSGAVRGIVIDTEGHPVKGAVITASNPNGRPTEIASTTDTKGRFAMIGLTGGAWAFQAEAPGFAPKQGRAFVRSTVTGNAPLEFVLSRTIAPPPSALSKQIEAELSAAHALRAEGRFEQAVAAYQDVLEKNPTLTSVQLVIGDAWRQKAARESAAARTASLDKADPDNERARIELALTHLSNGRAHDAETLVEGGAVAGASREMVFALAEVRFSKGETAGAEELFKRAAAMDPTWLRPRLQLGLLALRRGDKMAAAEFFKAVAAADAGSPEAAEAKRYLADLGL